MRPTADRSAAGWTQARLFRAHDHEDSASGAAALGAILGPYRPFFDRHDEEAPFAVLWATARLNGRGATLVRDAGARVLRAALRRGVAPIVRVSSGEGRRARYVVVAGFCAADGRFLVLDRGALEVVGEQRLVSARRAAALTALLVDPAEGAG